MSASIPVTTTHSTKHFGSDITRVRPHVHTRWQVEDFSSLCACRHPHMRNTLRGIGQIICKSALSVAPCNNTPICFFSIIKLCFELLFSLSLLGWDQSGGEGSSRSSSSRPKGRRQSISRNISFRWPLFHNQSQVRVIGFFFLLSERLETQQNKGA